MSKIISFVGELYQEFNGNFYTKPTSAAFLQDLVGKDNVIVASPCKNSLQMPENYSTVVDSDHFYPFPLYSSTKDFVVKSLFKRGFLKEYISSCDNLITKHKGSLFWARSPSAGSILFSLRVLKADQKLLHHMCADASNTWRDKKYGFIDKTFAYVLSRLIRLIQKLICRHPNTLNLCTGDVLEAFSRNVSPERTYQFVDVMIKAPSQPISQPKRDKLRLMFVGRVVADKGIFDLLNAIEPLAQQVSLTVVGDGPDFKASVVLAEKLGLKESVTFTGQLSHHHLSKLYEDSDLVVVPSNNFYEGFPRVIMEAWSYHVPVIVTHVGGIKAFVKDGINGLIVKPGDVSSISQAIDYCVKDDALLRKLSHGATEMAQFSIQRYWLDKLNEWISDI